MKSSPALLISAGLLLAAQACFAAALISLSHPATAQSLQPSFDCSKATTRIESIICSDPELAEWDASLGRAYKQEYARLVGNDRQGLIKDQRQWISSRNAQCNQSELAETKACIIQFTKSRLAALTQQNSQPLQLEDFRQTPEHPSSAPSPNYSMDGWHKVPAPSRIQYKVFHDKVVALSNLAEGCEPGRPFPFEGKIAKVNFDDYGTNVRSFALEYDDGDRSLTNVDRISLDNPGMTMVDLEWITQGLRTLIRPNWYIQGTLISCGAAGRFTWLDAIQSSSPTRPITPNASASAPTSTSEGQPQSKPVANTAEGIPLLVQGGTFIIPVQINGQITLNFTIDSGAADVTIPADVVTTLMRTGTIQKSDFIGHQNFRLADG